MKQKVSSANNQVEIIKLTSNAISVGIQNLAKVLKKKNNWIHLLHQRFLNNVCKFSKIT